MAGRSQANLHLNYPEGLRGTSLEAKVLYTRLLCDDALNHAGILPLRAALWADECEMSEGAIDKALRELEDKRYAYTDYKTHQVLVRTLVRNDGIADMPNVLWSACRCALNLRSRKLRRVLATELRKLAAQPPDKVNENTGKRYVYPDPHGTAAAIDPGPPDSTETHDEPSHRTLPGTLPNPSEGSPTPGGGGGGSSTSSVGSNSSSVGTATRRGTRIPDDFVVTDAMKAWARTNTPNVGQAETEQFLDYWHAESGSKAVKLDWVATWRRWMRTEQKRAEQRPAHLRSVEAAPPGPELRTFEDYVRHHAGPAAAELIRRPYLTDPKPPSDKTPYRVWEQQQALQFLTRHEAAIRAALAHQETA